MYHQAFCNPPISRQPYYGGSNQATRTGPTAGTTNAKPQSAIPKIKEALNLMRNHFFEIPYIATYRQEYIEPEINHDDLWKILYWDEKVTEIVSYSQTLRLHCVMCHAL